MSNNTATTTTATTVTNTIAPYLYAGAVRKGVSSAIDLLREQVIGRIPGDVAPAARAFLATPIGDGLLRLALAGAVTTIPKDRRPVILDDVKEELFISAAADGFDALQHLALRVADLVITALPTPPKEVEENEE